MRTTWLVMACLAGAACAEGGSHGNNQAPSAPEVSLSPLDPLSTDPLVAHLVVESVDPDGDEVTYRYAWIRDGVPQASLTTDTVDAAQTSRDEVWEVRVLATDGDLSSPAASATVTVRNGVPEVSATWANATTTTADDLAVVAVTTDADNDPVTLHYAWTLDGVPFAEATDTVSAADLAPGQVWHVVVTADDGAGGVDTAELDATILNSPPTVTNVRLSPSPAGDSQSLTAYADVVDADGEPVTFAWSFYRNGTLFRTGLDPVLMPSATTLGDTWTAEITATDGSNSTGPVASNPVHIEDLPPSQALVTITPARPQPCDNLKCDDAMPTLDPDGTPVQVEKVWKRNGVVWSGPFNDFGDVPAWAVEAGDVWTCSYTGTSNGLTGAPGVASVTVGSGDGVETFPITGPGPTELLIVIDDRTAGAAVQPLLGDAAPVLLDALDQANVDYHVGVTAASSNGVLVRTPAGVPYVDRHTPDAALTLAAMMQVGTRGTSQDSLGATLDAVSEPLASTANAGFFRAGDRLAILWANTPSGSSYYRVDNFVTPLEQRWSLSDIDARLLMHSPPVSWCAFDVSQSYNAILKRLRGEYHSQCSGSLDSTMDSFAADAIELPWHFALGRSVSNVHLTLIDAQGHRTTVDSSGHYDDYSWSLTIPSSQLTVGGTLEVQYDYTCTGSPDEQIPPTARSAPPSLDTGSR